MVRTPRQEAPLPRLVRNQARWTRRWEEIQAGRRRGEWATKAAKKALRPGLERLAHGKCAFCESPLGVTADPGIEHYVAKTIAVGLAFEWDNLFPACPKCNGAKGNTDHNNVLLKPDAEDPEPYFWVHPDTGELQPHPALDEARRGRAVFTRDLCDLNRRGLTSQRAELYTRVGRWLNRVLHCGRDPTGQLQEELEEFLRPEAAYKLVVRHVLERRGRPDLAAEDRRRFEARPQTTSSFTASQRTLRSRR